MTPEPFDCLGHVEDGVVLGSADDLSAVDVSHVGDRIDEFDSDSAVADRIDNAGDDDLLPVVCPLVDCGDDEASLQVLHCDSTGPRHLTLLTLDCPGLSGHGGTSTQVELQIGPKMSNPLVRAYI